MKLQWQQAPVKTQWGDEMVVASVAIDKDHTVDLYCERDQAPKVEAMFALAEQPAHQKPVTKFKSPGQRWEDGDDHDSRSEALYKFIADTDFKHYGDSFCFKSGGDGDNGETLMFILDCWFAQQHTSPPAQRTWQGLTDEEVDRALDAAKVPELPGGYESVELEIARAIEAKLRSKNEDRN